MCSRAYDEVLVLVELLADERLRLALVRRDEERLRLEAEPERLALRVEHRLHLAPVELADQVAVEVGVDGAWQRAREDDEVGADREVVQLLDQHVELVRRHLRPPLVDLRVRVPGGVDDRGRRPRIVLDPHEVVQDRLRGQLLDDAGARAPAGQAGGDDRNAEPFQRAGDVDPLAACKRQARACPVPLVELEVRHGERAVDGGVESDGDDHEIQLQAWWAAFPRYHSLRPINPGFSIVRDATSGRRAISR